MNEQAAMMSQQQQQQLIMNQNMMSMNQMNPQAQPQMVPMNRSYGVWPPPPQFQNPNPDTNVGAMKPPPYAFNKSLGPKSNWKGKKVNKPNDKRRNDLQKSLIAASSNAAIGGGVGVNSAGGVGNPNFNNYRPPILNELQYQNRLKTRKFFPKKKFNKINGINMNMGGNYNNYNNSRSAPFAPRNTTSFIIRAKKSGGIASLVSPSPMTPAVLPTPVFSPSREVLVDMAKEEWGVDGYGSMKGLIRLRSPDHEMEPQEDEDEDGGSSESDVEEHVEVERRLDHDLSRFKMIYNPQSVNLGGMEYHNVLENRVDDQDTHIAQLEEENLILKERLFLMDREFGELRRRLQNLEGRENRGEVINEEVVENESENEGDSRGGEAHSMDDNNEDFSEDIGEDMCSDEKSSDSHNAEGTEAAATSEKNVRLDVEKVENNADECFQGDKNVSTAGIESNKGNSDMFSEANKAEENNEAVENIKENCDDRNKFLDVEMNTEDKLDVEPSGLAMEGGDSHIAEAVAEDNLLSNKEVTD